VTVVCLGLGQWHILLWLQHKTCKTSVLVFLSSCIQWKTVISAR